MIINSIIIKIASRCNLNCTYCYVYNLGDTTYKLQPKLMADIDAKAAIDRSLEHCLEKKIKKFFFIFHGGEPLLQTKEFFIEFVNYANRVMSEKDIEPIYGVQTNGVLITKEWCETLNNLNVNLGISLDGYKELNDKYRVDHKGKGSYDNVIKGFKLAQNYMDHKPGILSVIDPSSNPLKYYHTIKHLSIDNLDLLWPHANMDLDTLGNPWGESKPTNTIYADWLIEIFNIWFKEKSKTKIHITVFDSIIGLLLNDESSGNEDFGNVNVKYLIVETNGEIQVSGGLKLCGHGFTKNDANIKTHSFSRAFDTKLANLYYNSHTMLCKKCINCPVVEICGGGPIHSRYSKKNGFNNESVLCHDFAKLIVYIQNAIYDSLPEQYQESWGKIDYLSVKNYVENVDMNKINDPEYVNELNI